MRAWALAFVACLALALASLVRAEFQTLQEGNGTPGRTSSTYAIVQDGQLVGLVEQVHSSSRVFGRRGGPSDAAGAHAMEMAEAAAAQLGARLAQLFSTQLDLASGIQDQLMGIRCPRARMAALAQLAAAAAGGNEASDLPQALLRMQQRQDRIAAGAGRHPLPAEEELPMEAELGDFEMVQQKLFGPEDEQAAEEAEAAMRAAFELRQPAMLLGSEQQEGAEERRHWRWHHEHPEHHHHEHEREHEHEHHHGPWDPAKHRGYGNYLPQELQPQPQWWDILVASGAQRGDASEPGAGTAQGFRLPTFLDLERTAMRVPGQEPDMSWRIRDREGRLNWGLIAFLALATACVAVWGALLAQCAVYRNARAQNNAVAYFIARAHQRDGLQSAGGSGPLKPLLREGPAKDGVEHASAHVPGTQAILHVLQYQPLSGSEH